MKNRLNNYNDFKLKKELNKKGQFLRAQISIFIILAIVIIVGIGIYFVVRGNLFKPSIPADFEPVYNYYLSCVQEQAEVGISVLESKGGYIESPEFSPGSEYMPFSSQLDFFGIGVPYWYYISENGVMSEQVPSKSNIQTQLKTYLDNNLNCNFNEFEQQGFIIELGQPITDVTLADNEVSVSVNQDISINKEDVSWTANSHSVSIITNLGKLYNLAKKIYNQERTDNFLETYGLDVLRLYAPVDGVEFTCAPKVWNPQTIKQELVIALEPNVQAIKLKGDYYILKKNETSYFVKDLGENIDVSANFLYSRNWPTKIAIYPDENPLIAESVGPAQGLGALGFCYVPYHFVYDFAYPVLVQLSSGSDMFQFPMIVVIDKNKPLKGLAAESIEDIEPELCKYKVQEITVNTYDINLDPVEADISFECLEEKCNIGKTNISEGVAVLNSNFPQCYNGFIVAKADGYSNKRYLFSTISLGSADIVLDKLYNVDINLKVDGQNTSDFGIISFNSAETTAVVSWPSQKSVNLSAGEYFVSVYIYRNSSIYIPATNQQKCVEATKSGLLGLFGATEEKCFDLNIPGQVLSNVIAGGGKVQDYFIESLLETGKLQIDVDALPVPKTLEDIQSNYNLLEVKSINIEFKNEKN